MGACCSKKAAVTDQQAKSPNSQVVDNTTTFHFTVEFQGKVVEFASPNGTTVENALKQVNKGFKRGDIVGLLKGTERVAQGSPIESVA